MSSNKDTLIQREYQRAKDEAHDMSSFIKSKYNLYVLAQIMLVGGMIISAVTEGWHLENKFSSLALAIVGVLLIESISVVMGNMVVNDIRSGIMSAGNIAKSMFVFSLVLYLGATYFSVSLTLDGAPDFYEFQRAQTAPPSQMNKDSVAAYFQQELAAIDADIADQKGTRWKGTITTQANRNINELIKMKQFKEQERIDALADVDVFNQDQISAWEADLSDDQKIVMGFAGLGEVIKIFAIIFIALFKEGRNKELGIHTIERKFNVDIDGDGTIGKPGKKATRPPGYYPSPAADGGETMETPTPTPRRPIGFFTGSTEADTLTHRQPSVANVSYTHEKEEVYNGLPISLTKELRFYADAKRQYDSYESNPRIRPETKTKNQDKFQAYMEHALQNLKERGYKPVLQDRNWILIEI